MFVIHNSSLTASKKTLIKRKFPYIDTFDQEVPYVIRAMCNLTAVVFKHLYITSDLDIDKRIKYTQRILRGAAPKK